jgi:hypothetical protein
MGFYRGPNIVTSGLLFAYDAGSERCYPGSGTSTTNIMSQASPGTLQNGVGFNTANGGFWEFDGVDNKIEVTNFPTSVFNGSCTMESWVYWNDDTRSTILGNYDAGANDVNFEKLTGKKLRFYWNRGERDVTASNVVVLNTWQCVVFVRDTAANAFKFYVNGILVATVSNDGSNIASTGSTFRIGADSRNGSTVTNGDISTVRMYNIALTAAQVTQNYNAQKTRFGL